MSKYIYVKKDMLKRAEEFLKLSGEHYVRNKKKWSSTVEGFDEDIYNDTIIKVYDNILKGADTDGDLMGYWYRSFVNNIKRKKHYSHNSKKEDVDVMEVLKEKEYEENNVNLYYSTISDILIEVKDRFDRKSFEVFRMYLLCNMSYEHLNQLTGLTDCKDRIMRIRKWLNGRKNID